MHIYSTKMRSYHFIYTSHTGSSISHVDPIKKNFNKHIYMPMISKCNRKFKTENDIVCKRLIPVDSLHYFNTFHHLFRLLSISCVECIKCIILL